MTDAPSNAPEYSVSELAFALKATIEQTYGRVRVRGELGRVTIAKSGHCYLDVKDDKAVINSIVWAGVMNRLPIRPEEGMEVICEGKLSTFPGRSNYQLIIDRMEPAGEGALMALLEKRKKTLAAEGLFDPDRKKLLPFMPMTIGVITSPTGAVIRDILHRIEDRFPMHVIVWPCLVQGDKAAAQISDAIKGFNNIQPGGAVPRPDVLIVGRGGGSLEDLWCFNEENVARAAAASDIALISAVGHETDWTLIDYISDYRAPTPTGAAEKAVPVRADLLALTSDHAQRLRRALTRTAEQARLTLAAIKLPRAASLLQTPQQRLDLTAARLPKLSAITDPLSQRLLSASNRLTPAPLHKVQEQYSAQLTRIAQSQKRAMNQRLDSLESRLNSAGNLLTAYSYQGVLNRGYAMVTDDSGAIVKDGAGLSAGDAVSLTFKDDVKRGAVITGDLAASQKSKPKKPAPKKSTPKKSSENQMGLF